MDSNNDTYVDSHQPTRDAPEDPLMNGDAKRNHLPVRNPLFTNILFTNSHYFKIVLFLDFNRDRNSSLFWMWVFEVGFPLLCELCVLQNFLIISRIFCSRFAN